MIKTNPLSVKDIEKLAMAFREHYQIKKDEYFPVLEIIDKLFEEKYLSYQIVDDNTDMLDNNTLAIYKPNENFIYIKESVIQNMKMEYIDQHLHCVMSFFTMFNRNY